MRLLLVVVAMVGAAGCGTAGCPDGYVESMGRCLDPDAGVDAADDEDAGRDAGDSGRMDGPDACTERLFRDGDGDGFGDPGASITSCVPMAGFVADDRDCDDACAECVPGGTEVCDLRDNDCDGTRDEDVTMTLFADCDRDEVAAVGAETVVGCATPTSGPTACPTGGWTTERPDIAARQDCADGDDRAFPGQLVYQSTPIVGAAAERDFDFDCDGVEEPRVPTRDNCVPILMGGGCLLTPVFAVECGRMWTNPTECAVVDGSCVVARSEPPYQQTCL